MTAASVVIAGRASAALAGDIVVGSEWHEAAITAGVRGFGGPAHGHPSRWDWGVTFATLEQAMRCHERMAQLANGLTPAQRDALWTTNDPRAAELRELVAEIARMK